MDRNKHTLAFQLRLLNSTAFTTTSFTAKTPTTTKPSGNGVVDLKDDDLGWTTDDSHVPDLMYVQPVGSNANNEDYHMRIFGWQSCLSVAGLWVPALLAQVTVTLGNIAATSLAANHFLADTITLDNGSDDLVKVVSPANDTPGYIVMDHTGFELIEFDFDKDAGSSEAASCNVLYRGVS